MAGTSAMSEFSKVKFGKLSFLLTPNILVKATTYFLCCWNLKILMMFSENARFVISGARIAHCTDHSSMRCLCGFVLKTRPSWKKWVKDFYKKISWDKIILNIFNSLEHFVLQKKIKIASDTLNAAIQCNGTITDSKVWNISVMAYQDYIF